MNEAFENGDQNAFPDDLVPSATCVMKSTQGLVQAANRLLNKYDDEVIIYIYICVCVYVYIYIYIYISQYIDWHFIKSMLNIVIIIKMY